MALAAAAPLLVATATLITHRWTPTGDRALAWLQTLDVGTRHTPLAGVYSRYGWDHPGPLQFIVSAPLVRAFGPTGMLATTGLVGAASVMIAVRAAARRGGLLAASLVGLVAVTMTQAVDRSQLLDPWNPRVGLFPLLAFLVCVWAAQTADPTALLAAVAAGSWCVQVHVGYAPVVLAGLLAGVAGRVLERRSRPARLDRRWVVGATCLGVLLWLPPLVQQLTHSPGNLTEMFDFFRAPHQVVGFHRGLKIAGHELGVPAAWMGSAELDTGGFMRTGPWWPVAALWGTAATTGLVALRRRATEVTGLSLVAVCTTPAAIVAMSRVTDFPTPYLFRWSWPVGAILVVATVFGLVRLADRAVVRRGATVLGAVILLVVSTGTVIRSSSFAAPDLSGGIAARSVAGQLAKRLDRDVSYRITWDDKRDLSSASIATAALLLDQGWALDITEPERRWLFRHWPTTAPAGSPTILLHGSVGSTPWSPPLGARLIARYDTLEGDAARRADALADRVRAQQHVPKPITDVGAPLLRVVAVQQGADPRDVDRLARIQAGRTKLDAWLVPGSG